ncbi:MAG TPA: CPBP family intramembrane glutamic endopeptidase [Polyangia bacterium]|nr:CPBP family intramembrane glutamic endopeptidase [Polyangia bacterium]
MISRGSGWSRPVLVMVAYLGLGAAALVWGGLRGQPNVWQVAGREEPLVLSGILLGLVLGLIVVFVSRLAVHRFEWARALHREFRALLSPLTPSEIVVMAAASSVGEEMFFRGALVPAIGVLGSSAAFALLHIGPRLRYLPWTLASFVAGLLLGQLFLWTGDLTGAVLAHFTINFLNLRHVAHYELR